MTGNILIPDTVTLRRALSECSKLRGQAIVIAGRAAFHTAMVHGWPPGSAPRRMHLDALLRLTAECNEATAAADTWSKIAEQLLIGA